MRAHRKRHVRERRSWARPLWHQVLVVLAALVAAAYLRFALPGHESVPLEGMRDLPRLEYVMFAAAIIIVVALWVSAARLAGTGRRLWNRRFTTSVVLCDVLILAHAVPASAPFAKSTDVMWLAGGPALALSALLLAPVIGRWRLDIRRREFNPPNRVPLLRAKTTDIDEEVDEFRATIVRAIREGNLAKSPTTRHLVRFFRLQRLKPDPRKVKEVEQRRRRVAAKGQARRRRRAGSGLGRQDRLPKAPVHGRALRSASSYKRDRGMPPERRGETRRRAQNRGHSRPGSDRVQHLQRGRTGDPKRRDTLPGSDAGSAGPTSP